MKTISTHYAKYRSRSIDDESSFNDFEAGFLSAKKEFNQTVLDSLNKYKSELSQEQTPKLGRTDNFEKQVYYKACIEVLLKLKNKLK
jgi:hypothetical protein